MTDGTRETQTQQQPAAPPVNDALERELDRLSLHQALLDFEIANARVVDLTERLVESSKSAAQLRHDLEKLKFKHAALEAEHRRILGSKAFRLVKLIWAIRRELNV
ncbi:MAG: hypothetical protein ACRDJ4_13530 [Actinomycetota bacterium]